MKMLARTKWLGLVTVTFTTLAGCAERPIAVTHGLSTQARLETAAHWEILARDTAADLVSSLGDSKSVRYIIDRPSTVPLQRPIYVRRLDSQMPFARAFHHYLVNELVSRGLPVSLSKPGAIVVDYNVQSIRRSARELRSVPGRFTLLAAGLIALREVVSSAIDHGLGFGEGAAIVGAGLLTDLFDTRGSASEVIITVSVIEGNRFLAQKSRTYYVRDPNLAEYASNFPPSVHTRVATAPREGAVRVFDLVNR